MAQTSQSIIFVIISFQKFIMIFPYSHSCLLTFITPATAAIFSRQVTNVGNVGGIMDPKVSSVTLTDLAAVSLISPTSSSKQTIIHFHYLSQILSTTRKNFICKIREVWSQHHKGAQVLQSQQVTESTLRQNKSATSRRLNSRVSQARLRTEPQNHQTGHSRT